MVVVEEDRSCLVREDRDRESICWELTCLVIGRVRVGSLHIGLRECLSVVVAAAGVDMRVEGAQKLVEK